MESAPVQSQDRLLELEGQLIALMCLCDAAIRSHPDPDALQRHWDESASWSHSSILRNPHYCEPSSRLTDAIQTHLKEWTARIHAHRAKAPL